MSRPVYLVVRLPSEYSSLLPALSLLQVESVDYLRRNDPTSTYLYFLCSLILDLQPEEIDLFTTASGYEPEIDKEWVICERGNNPYPGGTYLCQPKKRDAFIFLIE